MHKFTVLQNVINISTGQQDLVCQDFIVDKPTEKTRPIVKFCWQLKHHPFNHLAPKSEVCRFSKIKVRRGMLLIKEILHELTGSLSHHFQGFIYYIPGGTRFLPSTASIIIKRNVFLVGGFNQLENISQNGNLPQIGVHIKKNIWKHHPGVSRCTWNALWISSFIPLQIFQRRWHFGL